MAITATDILVKLSTGSLTGNGNANASTPAASLGGQMASTQITTATIGQLFDDVSGADNAASDVEYRCFFFHNAHASLSLTNSRVYVPSEVGSVGAGAEVAIALDTIGVLAYNTAAAMSDTVVDENTAPSPALTFVKPVDYATGLIPSPGGTVGPNQAFAVWVRRSADNSPAADPDGLVIRLEGDTLP